MPATLNLPSGLVTFLFTDIEGSTRLAQLLGTDYRPVLAEHRQILRRVFRGNGGVPLFSEGDSLFVAFPDANAAISACAHAQRALAAHKWRQQQPRVRMGLHSGYAEPHAGEYATPEVHRAARVAAAAHGGQVLCSAATARLAGQLDPEVDLRDLGLFQLRGFDGRERLFQLVAPGLEQGFPRPRTPVAVPHNLPAPAASFVGRRAECAELGRLVTANRLVTVVGSGGAGKTRLAVQVAGDMVANFADGVWFTDVAPVSDSYLVPVAVAEAVGVRPEPGRLIMESLVEYVAARHLLLVLDTCDAHLDAVVPVVSRLLAANAKIQILATSREPLGLPGELVWRVPEMGLTEPAGGGVPDAVALLLERASSARGARHTSADEVAHLHRVARRLNGIPLAIELAAARLRILSAAQLADRLDNLLDDVLVTLDAAEYVVGDSEPPEGSRECPEGGSRLLTADASPVEAGAEAPPEAAVPSRSGHRHATMRATVNWSYRTLSSGSARLLRLLSVFAGPVDLATVEWIVGRDSLGLLARLVDKSLVIAEPEPGGSGLRYRMLDPIRAFAGRALADAGERSAARDRHLAWLSYELQRIHTGADGRTATLSTYPFDHLAAEVRTGLQWSITGGSARAGLRLAVHLDEWWRERGLAREGRLWFFRLFERIGGTEEDVPTAEAAVAYHAYARHAGADGEYGEQLRLLVQAEEAAWRSGQAALIARVSAGRGEALVALGREEEAERACRDVIEWARARSVETEALPAIFCLAQLLWQRGDLAEAAAELGQARTAASAQPAERGRRAIDMLLGLVALSRGDVVAAHDHLVVALRFRMAHGYYWAACETLTAMAMRCAIGGELVPAATLFGAAQAARSRLRTPVGAVGPLGLRHEATVRSELGDAAFDRAYGEGTEMTLDEATAFALKVPHPDLVQELVRFTADSDPTADLSLPTF